MFNKNLEVSKKKYKSGPQNNFLSNMPPKCVYSQRPIYELIYIICIHSQDIYSRRGHSASPSFLPHCYY